MVTLLCCSLVFSQEKTITGSVTDSDGVPLAGASIVVVESNLGVATDFDGNYSIQATEGQTLLISYIGFETQEIVVGVDDNYNVILSLGNALDEVVVTSLGITRQKRELTFKTPNINIKGTYGTRPDANHGNTFYSKI